MKPENVQARLAMPAHSFGRRLYEARRARGLYIAQVARMTGVSIQYIASLERGIRDNPTLRIIRRLETLFPELRAN